MKANQQRWSVILGVSASVSFLTGCEQPYSLAKSEPKPAAAVTTRQPQVLPPQPVQPVVLSSPAKPADPVQPLKPVTPVVVVPVLKPTQPVVAKIATPTPAPTATPTPVPAGPVSLMANESFKAASNEVKKIDFLFVVDNSNSMRDNQRKLAAGFQEFAETFYRRPDLDICTMIITTDRYLGKTGDREYERERRLACTKPKGSEHWSAAQMKAHIDALIEDFEEKIYVGIYGSGQELPGKSLVSFLYGLPQWGDRAEQGRKTDFFRKDAVANISFLTDENNYFFEGMEDTEENVNDLPYTTFTAIPDAKNGQKDNRKGIKEYLDGYFKALNPGRAPTYSVTSLIELSRPTDTIPGIAVNLDPLPAAVGRESTKADISGPVETYTQVYKSIADAIVLRATAFTLAQIVKGDLSVRIRHSNGQTVALAANRDFNLQAGNQLTLTPKVLPLLRAGDFIDVSYRYTK